MQNSTKMRLHHLMKWQSKTFNHNLTKIKATTKTLIALFSSDFEKYACDILQRCYEIDREKAERTLKRPIPEYDDCTSIQAALLADDLSFIAHPCFQNVLTKVWYSKIEPDVSWISVS